MAGKFVWYDMMTYDKQGSLDFYCKTMGYSPMAFGETGYTMLAMGEDAMGGVETLPAEMKGQVPPHWIGYVSTVDIAATVKKIKANGGEVLNEMKIPSVGQIAIFADPQGAVAAAYQSETDPNVDPESKTAPGKVSWHELGTSDVEGAKTFYNAVFGWSVIETIASPNGPYHMWGDGDSRWGGIHEKPADAPVSTWMYYLHVPKLNDAINKVTEHGGRVLMNTSIAGGDVIAMATDAFGAAFALHAPQM